MSKKENQTDRPAIEVILEIERLEEENKRLREENEKIRKTEEKNLSLKTYHTDPQYYKQKLEYQKELAQFKMSFGIKYAIFIIGFMTLAMCLYLLLQK